MKATRLQMDKAGIGSYHGVLVRAKHPGKFEFWDSIPARGS